MKKRLCIIALSFLVICSLFAMNTMVSEAWILSVVSTGQKGDKSNVNIGIDPNAFMAYGPPNPVIDYSAHIWMSIEDPNDGIVKDYSWDIRLEGADEEVYQPVKIKVGGELFDGTDENFYINSGDAAIKNNAEGKILIDELSEIIESLNNDLRIPFLMSYQGYKYNEICDHLDLPLGTVKSRIFLARKKLKAAIIKRYGSQNALILAS